MVFIVLVPVGICNPNVVHIVNLFEFDDVHILAVWNNIHWNTAMAYLWAMNTAMTNKDQVSSKWLKMLLQESCTTEMKEVIMLKYSNFPICFHRGVTYAWTLCHKLFGLNCDTVAVLIKFLKLFCEKGLHCYQGENVALLACKELLVVCSG